MKQLDTTPLSEHINQLVNDIYSWDTKDIKYLAEKILKLSDELKKTKKYMFQALTIAKIPVNENFFENYMEIGADEVLPDNVTLYGIDEKGVCFLESPRGYYFSYASYLTDHKDASEDFIKKMAEKYKNIIIDKLPEKFSAPDYGKLIERIFYFIKNNSKIFVLINLSKEIETLFEIDPETASELAPVFQKNYCDLQNMLNENYIII